MLDAMARSKTTGFASRDAARQAVIDAGGDLDEVIIGVANDGTWAVLGHVAGLIAPEAVADDPVAFGAVVRQGTEALTLEEYWPAPEPVEDAPAGEQQADVTEPEAETKQPAEPEAQAAPETESASDGPDLIVQIGGTMLPTAARILAQKLAKAGFDVTLRACDTLAEVGTVMGHAKAGASDDVVHVTRDWTVKPVIASTQNKHVQGLIDKIDDARGNIQVLEYLASSFKGKNTYYRMARKFLDALIAKAKADQDTYYASLLG